MNECSINENLCLRTAVMAGMTLTGSQGTRMTELRGFKAGSVFADSLNEENAFSAVDDISYRKRRLEKEMFLGQEETRDDNRVAVSESSLSSDVHSSSEGEETEASSRMERAVAISPGGTCLSHGFVSVIGRRREMEDAVAIELGFLRLSDNSRDYDFFGVYDGHGGSRVANSCQGRLHHLLADECKKTSSYFGSDDEEKEVWSRIMMKCFLKMDEEVNRNNATISSSKDESFSATIGSTAVVAVVGENEVVVANCGDSRAVLSRGGFPLSISNDHKPDRPDELERIERAGGKVIDWDGHRVLGVLATSRSIGDQYLQPFVIPEPEVLLTRRSNADEFLILATDGLWDVVTNEMACLVVKKCLDGRSLKKRRSVLVIQDAKEEEASRRRQSDAERVKKKKNMYGRAEAAAGLLVQLAISRGSKDNISVVVVDLNKGRGKQASIKRQDSQVI